jgi:hypothetical protein
MTLYAGKASASIGKKRGRAVLVLATLLIVMAFLVLQSIAPEVALAASSWKDIPGPDNGDATALAYDSVHNMLYRGTGSRGVFRYNGTAWTDIGGAISGYQITSLAYDPTRNVLYAGCFDPQTVTGKGVWACSTPDTAPSWSDTGGGVSSYQIQALACDTARNLLYAGCFDPSDYTGHGVWACSTPDTAPSWSDTGGGVSSYQITALAYDGVRNLLYAGCYDTSDYTGHGVWACSTPDTSPSWSDTGGGVSGKLIYSLACDPDNDVLYAATDSNQVWACATPDTAPTWSNTSGAIFTQAVRSLAYDSNHNVLYAGMDAIGVWACATPNTTPVWNDTGGGVSRLTVKAMAYDSLHQILYAGMQYDGVWACNTTDEAPTWSRDLAFPAYPVLSLCYDSTHNVLYAGTGNNGIWACANPDTAPSWTNTGGGAGIYMVPSLAYDSINNVLYAATVGGGVWACAAPNTAPVWTGIGMSGGGWHGDIDSLAYDPVHNLLYTGVYGFGVWVCANPNTTPAWADTGGISIYSLPSLCYDSVHNVLYAGTWGGYGVFACATPDTTPVWTNTGGGVSGYSIFSLAYDAGSNVLYAGTDYRGVWECATPDTASNWSTTDGRVSNYQIDSLAYDAGHNVLYAGTDFQGAWYYSADTTPTVTTTSPSNFTPTTASSGGDVTADGGDPVTARGVCWSTSADPTTADSHTTDGTGTGTFTSSITGLSPGTLYHVRAYATNSVGTSYGDDLTFTTDTTTPTVTTTSPSDITPTTASSGGDVTTDGGDPVTARGVCWSTSPDPTTADDHTTDGTGTGAFTSSITGLTSNTTYHVRAYATNSVGTSYGADREFTTLNPLPAITSIDPSSKNTGDPGFTLTVNGGNFVPGSVVRWNGVARTTTYVSATKLTAAVPASDMSSAGTASVTVFNPAPGGGASNAKTFTVKAPPTATTTWYLAEGTNAWGFNTYISIANPNNEQLTARLTYMDPNPASGAGVVGTRDVTLPALSQTTISSQPDIGAVDFSTKVECLQGKQIAVDRTMFWTGQGAPSQEGHSSIGTTTPSETWYLPEGSSNWGFETWTLLQNPNATDAHVKLTYMSETGTPKEFDRTVPARSRASFNMASDVGTADASIKVTSDVPVVAERSMYRNNRREGSCSIGATTPAADFFLAEGACGYDVGFSTWVLVQNPNDSDVEVTLTYQTQSGPRPQGPFTMGANSRKTIKVNEQLPPNTNVSTTVHGSKPVIAERAMYWGAGTALGEAMHASIGLDSAHMSFYLPDGQTSDGHETWTLVANPNPASVTVRITYLPQGGGTPVSFTDEIPPGTRSTYNMADKGISGRASIMVQSLDGARPIIVERAMYWNSRGAGTDTIGGFSD